MAKIRIPYKATITSIKQGVTKKGRTWHSLGLSIDAPEGKTIRVFGFANLSEDAPPVSDFREEDVVVATLEISQLGEARREYDWRIVGLDRFQGEEDLGFVDFPDVKKIHDGGKFRVAEFASDRGSITAITFGQAEPGEFFVKPTSRKKDGEWTKSVIMEERIPF